MRASLFGIGLLSLFSLQLNRVAAESEKNATAEVAVSNPLVDYLQCASGDKEWRVCFDRNIFRTDAFSYCPTVLEFNSTQVLDLGYYIDSEGFIDCFTCPNDQSDCETVVSDVFQNHNISKESAVFWDMDYPGPIYPDDDYYIDDQFDWELQPSFFDRVVGECRKMCEQGKEADECSMDNPCTVGSHFCDFSSDEDFALNISGTCKACPSDLDECYKDGFVSSAQSKQNCFRCRPRCFNLGESSLRVNGKEVNMGVEFITYDAILKSYQNVSGPLVDCSNLLLENVDDCPGAKGRVCFIDASSTNSNWGESRKGWELHDIAKLNGCAAIVAIVGSSKMVVSFSYANATIPFVLLNHENQSLHKNLGDLAQVQTQVVGIQCYLNGISCNNRGLSCSDNEYCYYVDVVVDGEYTEGWCWSCPTFDNGDPDPAACFFYRGTLDDYWIAYDSTPSIIKSCAVACDASLVSKDCKWCPTEVSALDFGVDDKADQCFFCPNNDMRFRDRNVPLFGENITCAMVQLFFNRVEVHKDSQNCRLVQSMNYICGCEGVGYAGADTTTKQAVLVWLPRVSAILSILGSLFIIYDTLRTQQKRKKLANQLLSTLSLFDIFGSTAYALATLPTPTDDFLYGAKGNDETCKAQGFFIQVGTIACLLNVSLAIYYHLTIVNGWTEGRFKRTRVTHVLFIVPIVVGLAFACAGIGFYDNARVWCNNSAKWWPEIPVIIAIILATTIMGSLCFRVYRNEMRSAQYTGGGARRSTMVFKQSCWFVVAFYITWVPYLTLQFMLSSGKGYDNYGLVLSSATLVPLQGFWNSVVYIRPRYLSDLISSTRSSVRRVTTSIRFWKSSNTNVTDPSSTLGALPLSAEHAQKPAVEVVEKVALGTSNDSANPLDEVQLLDGEPLAATQDDVMNVDREADSNGEKMFHVAQNQSDDVAGQCDMDRAIACTK